jgi:hypothetical protein
VYEIGRRETRWCRTWFRLLPEGKIVISHIIRFPSCGEDGRGGVPAVAGYGDPGFPVVEGPVQDDEAHRSM